MTSDRWWAYATCRLARRQLCWSHLQRDFTAHAEGLAAEKEFGEAGLELCERVFWAWEVFQHTDDRPELKRTIRQLQRDIRADHPRLRHKKSAQQALPRHGTQPPEGLARAMDLRQHHDGVQPTNNHAERALRGAVIYRKLSLGSQSETGERRIERLLSASITCRLQHRSLFAYLTDLLTAHARGDPTPSLA